MFNELGIMSSGTSGMGAIFSAQCCNVEAVPSAGRTRESVLFATEVTLRLELPRAEARSYYQSNHDSLGPEKKIEAVEMT